MLRRQSDWLRCLRECRRSFILLNLQPNEFSLVPSVTCRNQTLLFLSSLPVGVVFTAPSFTVTITLLSVVLSIPRYTLRHVLSAQEPSCWCIRGSSLFITRSRLGHSLILPLFIACKVSARWPWVEPSKHCEELSWLDLINLLVWPTSN